MYSYSKNLPVIAIILKQINKLHYLFHAIQMIHNVKTATFCRYMNLRVEVASKKVLKQFYIFRNLSEKDVYWTNFPFKKQIRKALFSWLKTSLTNSNDENRLNISPQCSLTVFYSSLSDFIRIKASLQNMITFREWKKNMKMKFYHSLEKENFMNCICGEEQIAKC